MQGVVSPSGGDGSKTSTVSGASVRRESGSSAEEHKARRPLVAHVIFQLGTGGLENGLVNLINFMPEERYRHAIISLTDCTAFRERIERDDVKVFALHKRAGKDIAVYARLWRLLRQMRPDIVHTRNLAALVMQAPAALAGVPWRVHGEHGRDVFDLEGKNRKYNLLRWFIRPLVHRYIAVSRDLEHWLVDAVGVRRERLVQIYNGVDTECFYPRHGARVPIGPDRFMEGDGILVGTVGRMAAVKDQLTLARAFLRVLEVEPGLRARLRLVMIGDGPLRGEAIELLRAHGAEGLAWLPGDRTDIPDIIRALDIFVLPSLGEGISNTILEAMSSGLPVIATRVGGNPELVQEGHTGILVPPAQPEAMGAAILDYIQNPERMREHGQAGRARVEREFSISRMVEAYMAVYDAVLRERAGSSPPG